MSEAPANAATNGRYGIHGRALVVDLSTGEHSVEEVPEQVYRQFLGGYGLGAWLMWRHFPAGADALAPESCFAIV
ncbi:MAG TPA: aldehyde ferredoxin oxidoreductase N-terminal domain-containing protein, partial [Thermoanaerobaculia bacterium]|nr:aldehyde ferredoxin oxidoreductase N-terminal domain-containing protein [Thermoanaerobaculia bacterium]